MIGLPVDPLAVRLVGEAYGGVSRPGVGAVDERGNDDAESAGGETPRELRRRVDPGRETRELLRGLIRVRERDDVAHRRVPGLEQQAFALHSFEHRPAHLIGAKLRGLGRERAAGLVSKALQARRQPRIDEAEHPGEAGAVRLDRARVAFGRRRIAPPVRAASFGGARDLVLGEAVEPVHHARRKIPLPVERGRAGERLGRGDAALRRERKQGRHDPSDRSHHVRPWVIKLPQGKRAGLFPAPPLS